MNLLGPAVVGRLREALTAAGYSYDGVSALLGVSAHAALGRNETTPGLRASGDGSALAILTRLWPLQAAVPVADLERALPGLVAPLAEAGVLQRSTDEVRALVDVRPYADEDHEWWVVSDLTPGLDGAQARVGRDHVLGVSSASTTLARLTVRDPVDTALDLGTGCGVQSLHLSGHADRVVATDLNERALAMARLNAALNDVALELRAGSLFEPVTGEQFDLVVSNPPFVVGPATAERLVYRDSGMPGDEVVRRIVRDAPGHLRPGGWCQVLANWVHVAGEPWEERLTGWLDGSGCDAWVVQRETVDPAAYVELWLQDAGLHGTPGYAQRYDAWLSWFEEQHVEAVGLGWLNLRRTGRERAAVRMEHWPYEVEQPLGEEVAAWARRTDLLLSTTDEALLAARLVRAPDVLQETVGEPGAQDPERIVLRRQRGMRRARQVDTVEAALVGACDGELTLGQILDAVASLTGREPAELRAGYPPVVRELVGEGFLTA